MRRLAKSVFLSVQDFCHGHSNCLNGATCENKDSDYECLCKDGWTGNHCDIGR